MSFQVTESNSKHRRKGPPSAVVIPIHGRNRPGFAELERLSADLGPDDRAYLHERVQHEVHRLESMTPGLRRAGPFRADDDGVEILLVQSSLIALRLSNLADGKFDPITHDSWSEYAEAVATRLVNVRTRLGIEPGPVFMRSGRKYAESPT